MDRFCCVVPLGDLDPAKDRLTGDEEGDNYFKQFADMWGGPAEAPVPTNSVKPRPTKKMFAK